MVSKFVQVKLDKKDYFRALLTDTAPSDVPIIFSNDGFYINWHRINIENTTDELTKLIKELCQKIMSPQNNKKFSIPYKYNIIKDDKNNFRQLSLLHPKAQLDMVNFYKNWSNSITYLCSLSPISIRAAIKVANSFYTKDVKPNRKYKEINIDTLQTELQTKYASSFFSYKGVDRFYKIFSKKKYIDFEKKYTIMWEVDVSKCFASIYTHSISWAIKNKEYAKEFIPYKNQFCQEFDSLIQRTNHNETNGIPIGAEVSRIFAEIIFQKIDLNLIERLQEKYSYKLGIDYDILRYVDDYILFSVSEDSANRILHTLSDCLSEYNLYFNENKLRKYNRPFLTEKSAVIIGVKDNFNNILTHLFRTKKVGDKSILYANKIYKPNNFCAAFITKVKKHCISTNVGYSSVSAYLVSACCKRIILFIESINSYTEKEKQEEKEIRLNSITVFFILVDIMFFFHGVHSTVQTSNNLAKAIIIIDRFIRDVYPNYLPFIRTEIMQKILQQLPLNMEENNYRENYLPLEKVNIILATGEFGTNYLRAYTKISQ